jgi:Protein of unknown function (DUF3224)
MKSAEAVFTNTRYEEHPFDEHEGTALGRVEITRSFNGDLEGESTALLLTATSEGGSAAYVALDRVTGRLDGRAGSFVFQHRGIVSPDGAETSGSVVPGSGAGQLSGLRGEGRIAVDEDGTHRLLLEYDLDG